MMMPNHNTITIAGHLGENAVMKETKAGHVTEFRMAVNYGKKDDRKASWFTVETWHEVAKGCQHLRKGDPVVCVGKMRQDRWQTDGAWHERWKLVADVVGKCLYVKDDPSRTHEEDYHDSGNDDDIPF